MIISVFGLGYVGTVAAACFADLGHQVHGVDPDPAKVDLINAGQTPVAEPQLGEIIERAVNLGQLTATAHAAAAVADSELSMVCVGTPSAESGDVRLTEVQQVCREIGAALRDRDEFHVVVISSTVPPGSVRGLVIPTLEEASGKRVGEGFGVCMSPEFLREGSAVADFMVPSRVVVGATDDRSAAVVERLYENVDAPLIRTEIETAEMVKLTDNAWHALKVTFGNEIGRLSKAFGVDSHRVMEIFVQDTKLNISPTYLKPGFAFGGSCLPKDLRTLNYRATASGVDLPMLASILPSNALHVERAAEMVLDCEQRRVTVLGLSFKADTDDLRESPAIELTRRLLAAGSDVRVYDPAIQLDRLIGANQHFVERVLPELPTLLVDSLEAALEHGDVVVVANNNKAFTAVAERIRAGQVLIDLTGSARPVVDAPMAGTYDGICW